MSELVELFSKYCAGLSKDQKLAVIQKFGFSSWNDLITNGNIDEIKNELAKRIAGNYIRVNEYFGKFRYEISRPENPSNVGQISFSIWKHDLKIL